MNPGIFLKFSHWVLGSSCKPYDYADSLHFPYTTILLLGFVCVLWLKQYVFKPLQCWVPQEFSKPWEEYAEYYCWVSDTYYNPVKNALPENPAERTSKRISYYQWVPFVLIVQSLIFWVPCILWHLLAGRTSIPLTSLIRAARDAAIADPDQRERTVSYVARCLLDVLLHNNERRKSRLSTVKHQNNRQIVFGRNAGNYLTMLYFLMKLLLTAHAVGEIYLITLFTETNYTFYGFELLRDVINGVEWQQSGIFPRVTWCDFEIRSIGNVHRHSIMCVLPNNMLHEKIYIFLWWWLCFIAGMTFLSIFVWMRRLMFQRERRTFICRYLKYMEALGHDRDKRMWQTFVDSFLRTDGVFILYLVADKAGDIIAGEIVVKMWQVYKQNGAERKAVMQGLQGMSSIPRQKMNGMPDSDRLHLFAKGETELP